MNTFKKVLAASVLVTSVTNLSAQSLSKAEKRAFLQDRQSTGTSHQTEASAMQTSDYKLSVSTGTYSDLTGATSINGADVWDDPEYIVPIGFTFTLYDENIDSVHFGIGFGGMVASKIDYMLYEADYLILPFETDLLDRGDISGVSQSPISYKVEGAAGSRIFKLEWKNAGFYDEYDVKGTLNDFINFQLWLYEGSNEIEIRFGPSMITNPTINYFGETGAMIGLGDFNANNAFLLSGSPANPTISNAPTYINGTPADGQIYRFYESSIGLESFKSLSGKAQAFPNPFDQFTTLKLNSDITNGTLRLTDVSGRTVKTITNLQGEEIHIDRDKLIRGVYFYHLSEGENAIAAGKLLVE